jgi:protein-tyrosine-phosphatase
VSTPRLLFVCTGNATRSVIAESLVRLHQPEWVTASAGTWAIPGLPSSRRTLAALQAVGVQAPGHRSTTLTRDHLADADLVICFEIDHVRHIRRLNPAVSDRAATLPRLIQPDWPGADLADEDPQGWPEVIDPAGGDTEDFIACARQIARQVEQLIPRIHTS